MPVNPENPVSAAVELSVKVPVVFVMVPVPLKVPDSVIPLGIVGLAPNGKVQLEFTVLTPVCPEKFTELNAWLPHESVAVLPVKFTVPELCVNVPAV